MMAPRKPNIPSKKRKRKFKKTSPPPRLSTAQIRRLTVDGEAVTDAPFVPDVLRSGRFKNVELGMKDMPAGYQDGGKVGKKKVDITKMSLEELDRYIQQLKEPLVVKPVKKNKGGGLNAAIKRVKKVQGMEEGGEVPGKRTMEITPEMMEAGRALEKSGKRLEPQRPKNRAPTLEQIKRMRNIEFIRDGIRMKPVTKKMEDGGEVPKKFKGFSKLPEDVQQQMNPTLAAKYEDGGEVRGMGRAYRGAPRKVKIR